jgi:voltage-gated potassium channel Kch
MSIHGRLRRLVLGATLASIATLSVAGAAAAHECYNASRTEKADANAAGNSQAWMWASEVLVAFVIPGDIFGEAPLSPDELAEALAIIEAERAAGVAVYDLDRALLGRATAASGAFGKAQSSDGRGIDHATENLEQFDPLIGHLIGVFRQVRPAEG